MKNSTDPIVQDALEEVGLPVELSPEEQAAQDAADEARQARLDAFAAALSKKRTEAVNARAASGIEQQWMEDEEFYEGIDDANRSEDQRVLKPVNQSGQASSNRTPIANRSTVFLNITRPYVDFSAGRAADMLLPTDDRAWEFKPTPMTDIEEQTTNGEVLDPQNGMTIGQAAQQMIEEAKAKVKKAQTRVEDWHVEGQFHSEVRKIIKDAAKVGVSILKGPFPIKRKMRKMERDAASGAIKLTLADKVSPTSKRIDYWNFYPSAGCGENIHNGTGTWERDYITARQLRDLKGTVDSDGQPMYIEGAIDKCLTEGPGKKLVNERDHVIGDSEQFEIWYFHGTAEADDMQAAGCKCDDPAKVFNVVITMVNDHVIKAELSPLDSGEFPYDVMVWQPMVGSWAGIGVARQVRTPQRMINAGTRNMMDNAGLAAGPQIVVRRGVVTPADGILELKPRKFWFVDEDANMNEVGHAFQAVTIPMMQQELLEIIQFALKMAEDVTGLPMLMQGQQGSAPETVGGMTMLQNNSSTVLRAIAKSFDDRITEPHIRRYYEWLMLYGPDDNEKGEFVIDARGSTALFERDAQNQAILQMAQLVVNPAFGIDPKRWIKEALLAQRLDPKRFQFSEQEIQQIEKQQQENPPQDPRIAATQITAQARIEAEKIKAEVTKEKIARDTDRDTAFVQSEQARDQSLHEATMAELALRRELAMLDYSNKRDLTLEQVKAKLADTTMKLNVQKDLSIASMQADLHKHHNPAPDTQVITPPDEPAGRADDGQAFAQ